MGSLPFDPDDVIREFLPGGTPKKKEEEESLEDLVVGEFSGERPGEAPRAPTTAQPQPFRLPGEHLVEALTGGVGIVGTGVGGTTEAVGRVLGVETVEEAGRALRTRAAPLIPSTDFRDALTSPQGALEWLEDTILGQIPVSGSVMAGASVGARLGAPVHPLFGTAAGILGGALVSYVIEAGSSYHSLIELGEDPDTAAVAALGPAGVPKAILETAMPVRWAGKLVWLPTKELAKRGLLEFAKRGGAAFVREGLGEAATETMQELVDMVVERELGHTAPLDAQLARLLNSAAGGMVGGGVIGGGISTYADFKRKPGPPTDIVAEETTAPPPAVEVKEEKEPGKEERKPKPSEVPDPIRTIRDWVLKERGREGLYASYTPEEFRELLGLDREASLSVFGPEEGGGAGLIVFREGRGIEFTKKVRGQLPFELGDRWGTSKETPDVFYLDLKDDGSYYASIREHVGLRGEPKVTADKLISVDLPYDSVLYANDAGTLAHVAERVAADLATLPQGWQMSTDPVRDDSRFVYYHVGDRVLSPVEIVYDAQRTDLPYEVGVGLKQVGAEGYQTIKEAFAAAQQYLGPTVPLGQSYLVQFYTFSGGTEASLIRDFQADMEQMPLWEPIPNSNNGQLYVKRSASPTLKKLVAADPWLQRFARLADSYVGKAVDILSGPLGEGKLLDTYPFLQKHPHRPRLREAYVPGLVLSMRSDRQGALYAVSPDYSKFRIGLDPYNGGQVNTHWESLSVVERVSQLYANFVHELTHMFVMGHGKKPGWKQAPGEQYQEFFDPTSEFAEAYLEVLRAVLPLKMSFLKEFGELYGSKRDPNRISDDALSGFKQLFPNARVFQAHFGGLKTGSTPATGPPGQAAGRLYPSSSVGRDVAAQAGEVSAGREEARGIRNVPRLESRGDFAGASDAYQDLVESLILKPPSEPTPDTSDPAGERFAEDTGQQLKGFSHDEKERVIGPIKRFSKFYRHCFTLLQLAERFQNIPPLQSYVNHVREFWKTKCRITIIADRILRDWQGKLDKVRNGKLANFIFTVMDQSHELQRRLTDAEIAELAAKKGLDEDTLSMWTRIDKFMQDTLQMLKEAYLEENRKIYKQFADIANAQVEKDFGMMAERNYFPATRFGQYVIMVKARSKLTYKGDTYRKGQRVRMETLERRRARDKRAAELDREFARLDVDITRDYIPDQLYPYMSLPPAMFELMVDKLGLTPKQILLARDLMYKLTPGKGFVKHLTAKAGIAGYSQDAIRVFADYAQHASNHLARKTWRWDLENDVKALNRTAGKAAPERTDLRMLMEAVNKHKEDLFNPGDDLGWIRGGLFTWFFGFVPKQAVVNLTQLPIFTFSYLATQHGGLPLIADAEVSMIMAKAMKDSTYWLQGKDLKALNDEEKRHFDRGFQDGFMDESTASEVAGLAERGVISRMLHYQGSAAYNLRRIAEWSTWMFKISEEYNRRVTFLSALRLADKKGLTGDRKYEFARTAVEKTQFEYARWNRPELMRGRKAVIFVFKAYLQHALHFALSGAGGARFWLMMLLFGGLKGLPFAEDMLDLVDSLGTYINQKLGTKNPRVDLEADFREFAMQIGLAPDTFMNGIARSTMGLTGLNYVFGTPIPMLDFSASIQLGRILPGAEATAEVVTGQGDFAENFLRAGAEFLGVAGTTGMNFMRVISEDRAGMGTMSDELMLLMRGMPGMLKNMSKVYFYLTREALTNSRGEPLVDLDLNDPVHQAEVVGQLIGAIPTRAMAKIEQGMAQREPIQYYMGRREVLLTHYAAAVGNKDREAITDAKKALIQFNRTSPPEFRLTVRQLATSIKNRVRNQKLRQMGLPAQKRYQNLYQKYQGLYSVESQPGLSSDLEQLP